jgi:hypothetical protein
LPSRKCRFSRIEHVLEPIFGAATIAKSGF